ncbi:hypothetical protein [Rivularia sp. UHCC 0363]|uniref:hypothetical protein n=1 Tax=Rivularia sp. UHCC 0363 TaxID=3110244 RepID=UPI002B2191AE|nr:hypothetical protein [Rivularia sp. UHCC 0363]MEA5597858.1 hypothetical protein [Rivularia sp. UHCC 0363]
MSHQLSFLQGFVGYGSVQSNLFTALKSNRMLKKIQQFLRIESDIGSIVKRLLEIILLADIGKFLNQISQELKLFQHKCLSRNTLALGTKNTQWNQPTTDRLRISNYQYIRQLKKFVTQSSSGSEQGDIFYFCKAMWQCNYWLKKIQLFKKKVAECEEKLIYDLQRWLVERNIYRLSKFQLINH